MAKSICRGHYAANVLMNAEDRLIEKLDKNIKRLRKGGRAIGKRKVVSRSLPNKSICTY